MVLLGNKTNERGFSKKNNFSLEESEQLSQEKVVEFVAEQIKKFGCGYIVGCTLHRNKEQTSSEFAELVHHHLPVATPSLHSYSSYFFFISEESHAPFLSIQDFHSILEDDLGESVHLFKSTRLDCKTNWHSTLVHELDLFFKMLHEDEAKFYSSKRMISKHIENSIHSLLRSDYSWYIESFKHIDLTLIETIKCLIEQNLNVVECSRKMYLHRNTVMYRLNRFQELSGFDLKSTQDRLLCYHICNLLMP